MTNKGVAISIFGLLTIGLTGCGLPREVILESVSRDERLCELHTIRNAIQWEWNSKNTSKGYGMFHTEPSLEKGDPQRKGERKLIFRGYWSLGTDREHSKNCYQFSAEAIRPAATSCVEWESAEYASQDDRAPKPNEPAISPTGRYLALQIQDRDVKNPGWYTTYAIHRDSLTVTDRASGKQVLALRAKPSTEPLEYFWVGNGAREMIVVSLNPRNVDVLVIPFKDESRSQ